MKNGMAKRKQFVVGILAIALAVLLLVTACAPVPTAPVGKEVRIAAIEPITGAAGVSAQIVLQGIDDYLRYFDEEIGIPRVTIELV
jgi:hypothetical protein